MIMLSDLWRTEEHKQEGNTNKNKKASSEDRKRTFSNDSDASSEKSAIETEGRTSEARRICCKARLLSRADHNADNAYFEIPLDTPHGMVMSCSHPKCAASGRRFRYCRGKVLHKAMCANYINPLFPNQTEIACLQWIQQIETNNTAQTAFLHLFSQCNTISV